MYKIRISLLLFLIMVVLQPNLIGNTGPEKGEFLYLTNCSSCHGVLGNGDGLAAKYLSPLPRDFTAGKYKFRTTPSGSLPTNENLYKTIRDGVKNTTMPAWYRILNDQEIQSVTEYIKTFSEKFSFQTPDEEIVIPETIPEKTDELVHDGEMIYRLMECWTCHGAHGNADGPSSKKLQDDWGNPIQPPDFAHTPFKGGDEPNEVYRTFSTGLMGTPMPAYDDEVFAFVREDIVGNYFSLKSVFSDQEIDEFDRWAKESITGEELSSKPEEDIYSYLRNRKWALVYYVLDQRKKQNFIFKLFTKDYELTE